MGGNAAVGPLVDLFSWLRSAEASDRYRQSPWEVVDLDRAGRDLDKRLLEAEARVAKALRGKKLGPGQRDYLERRADYLRQDLKPQEWDSQHEVAPLNILFPEITLRKHSLLEEIEKLL